MSEMYKGRDLIPESPVGNQMKWFLDIIFTKGEGVTESQIEERFNRETRRVVNAKLFLLGLPDAKRILGDFEFEGIDEEETNTDLEAYAIIGTPALDKFRFAVKVEYDEPNLIEGIIIIPAPDLRPEPAAKSFEEFEEKFKGLAKTATFLAGELVKDEFVPMYSFNETQNLPVGRGTSTLFVLAEVARRVEEGETRWLTEIPVKDSLKGVANSAIYDKKDGESFSIQHFGEEMMKGDGLAADHLIDLVGRDSVEKIQERLGLSMPELNSPFLTSREFVVLKAGMPKKSVDEFVKASAAKRLEFLENKVPKTKPPTIEKVFKWDEPRWTDSIGWFASSEDLIRAMIVAKEIRERPKMKTFGQILAKSPGLPFDKYAWLYTGHVSGYEPGVVSWSWILGRVADDRWFAMSATLNDPAERIDAIHAYPLLMAASDMLAFHRKKAKKGKEGKSGRFRRK